MKHIRIFSLALCFVFLFSACDTPTRPAVETETEGDTEQAEQVEPATESEEEREDVTEPEAALESEEESMPTPTPTPESEPEAVPEPETEPEPEEEETVAQSAEIALAQCLTEKGATLYTASWCGHCQSQKAEFGEGLQYLDNVECAAFGGWSQECKDAGVEAVPTWIFGDGAEKLGNTPLETLAALNNCEY